MNEWLKNHIVCPRDRERLEFAHDVLTCPLGHAYPVFDGVPVMLVDDVETTHDYITRTLEQVGVSSNGAAVAHADAARLNEVDAFVQGEIPYTSGTLYFAVQHRLTRYPIPDLRLGEGNGERLLDVGCNWGRWSIAAAQKNYRPVGIDPSLDAVLAARRVSQQLGVEADFVVGDARFLPFDNDAFDIVFSYSVLQHFSKNNVRISLDEITRVLKEGGRAFIQMPNRHGLRSFYNHWRRGFTEGEGFDVRYWTPPELRSTFEEKFGPTKISTDCYFGLGIQASDVDLLPFRYKLVVYASNVLRRISKNVPALTRVADSLYLDSINEHKQK